jgi:hypothetical protein
MGETYRVIKTFRDGDADEHPVGEEWVFLGSWFNKFENESLFWVRLDCGEEWKIPLVWEKDRHEEILVHWQDYLKRK